MLKFLDREAPRMASVERFEDLVAWQKAGELAKSVYRATALEVFAKDYGLRDQVRRASVSVMPNIAEGVDRAGRAAFHQFLVITKGSAAEVRSQLYIALDAGSLSQEQFDEMNDKAEEVTRSMAGLRLAVQKQKERGK